MHSFELQNSTQTLEEGLAEYYAKNPGLVKGRANTDEATEFFRCHDAVHVVFGCGNSLTDEAIVKISSIFGTTGGFRILQGYALHESREIYRALRVVEILKTALNSFVVVSLTIIRCRRMPRRWPWRDFDRYLGVPLKNIREEFGVRVPHRSTD